jgi:hypothetical protein
MSAEPVKRITRQDIEEKFRELSGSVGGDVEEAKPRLVTMGVVAVAVVLVGAYLLGRRAGRRKSAVVEIRRL